MNPERMEEIESVSRKFKPIDNSIFSLWKDIRNTNFEGDCQDYMFTVGKIYFGGTLQFWIAVFTLKAFLWRGVSVKNWWFLPRHAVLYIPEEGYIDSNDRKWRPKPAPTKLRYPIGAPIVLFVLLYWTGMLPIAISLALSLIP